MQIASQNIAKTAEVKQQVRKEFLQKRLTLTPHFVEAKSRFICTNIFTNFFLIDKIISLYMPIRNEVNLHYLLDYGVNDIVMPKVSDGKMDFREWKKGDVMESGNFGMVEPCASSEIIVPDVVIAPIVAFNEEGYRVGYGGGFYDRYLANFDGLMLGVAFEMQKTSAQFQQMLDIKLDYIITESNIYSN
jgi:5-formyltetrahydrofolate cyclo-ligase